MSLITAHTEHQYKSLMIDSKNQGGPSVCESPPLPSHSLFLFKCVQPPRASAVRWLWNTVSWGQWNPLTQVVSPGVILPPPPAPREQLDVRDAVKCPILRRKVPLTENDPQSMVPEGRNPAAGR